MTSNTPPTDATRIAQNERLRLAVDEILREAATRITAPAFNRGHILRKLTEALRDPSRVAETAYGANVRRLRKDAHVSQTQLARALGWAPSRVSNLEGGQLGIPAADVSRIIAATMKVDIDQVLDPPPLSA